MTTIEDSRGSKANGAGPVPADPQMKTFVTASFIGARCINRTCENRVGESRFIGELCVPCRDKLRHAGIGTFAEHAAEIYAWCGRKGWNQNLNLGEMMTNCHAELSEAWEEIRNNRAPNEIYENDSKPGKPEGFPVEIADTIIRLLHICHHYSIDIEEVIRLKMAYNEKRPYRHGGKAC